MPEAYDGPYRVFTDEHDLTARTADAIRYVSGIRGWDDFPDPDYRAYSHEHSAQMRVVESTFAARRVADSAAATNAAVSLLLDHSGSLRGEMICFVALLAGVASRCLAARHVQHEVLGFTTSSWHGGASASEWRRIHCPPSPGRLCDILHIIHRSFDDTRPLDAADELLMTHSGLLKENVDGEALQWAAQRLRATSAHRKILIVVSDGAPVDDATLSANGPNILDDHLKAVVRELSIPNDLEVYGVGIEYAMHRYYPQYVVLSAPADIASTFEPFLAALLSSDAHKPTPDQFPHPSPASD